MQERAAPQLPRAARQGVAGLPVQSVQDVHAGCNMIWGLEGACHTQPTPAPPLSPLRTAQGLCVSSMAPHRFVPLGLKLCCAHE